MAHMIELHKVSKYYSNKDTVSTGFSKLDLALDMGEFVAITGESGSGKSTLLNVISGLDSYEEGEMFVNGEDTSGYKTEEYEKYRKTYIGNIFQDFNLINSYTVYQNIELSMLLCGKSKSDCKGRVNELIELVGLTEYRRTKASKLSGGQKQRVAIARALAKDAPIIVADEPTGNLDSVSAQKVMETLHKISGDKLVVIVTHNYEQAEPYVTRKLTMHDGRLIEDKKIELPQAERGADSTEPETAEATDEPVRRQGRAERHGRKQGGSAHGAGLFGDMTAATQLRLGVRNTFNLPSKFFLLLIVYLFVSSSILSQYAATKTTLHDSALMGANAYFTNSAAERVVVKKEDNTAFTEEDYAGIAKLDNVDYIIRNDLTLDIPVYLEADEFSVTGGVYPAERIAKEKLSFGTMPQADNEVVIKVTKESLSYKAVKAKGGDLLGKEYYALSVRSGERVLQDKLKVVGVIIDEHGKTVNGNDYLYGTEGLCNNLLISNVAEVSASTIDYNGTKVKYKDGQRAIFASTSVPEGQAYIFEDQNKNYKDSVWKNKPITLNVEGLYFTSSLELKVGNSVTAKTIKSTLGFEKEEYDVHASRVYVNPTDFNRLFDRGNYQSSVFVKDEIKSEDVVDALKAKGYTAFSVKSALSDISGGFSFVIKLISVGTLIIEFLVLFFIAYAVIRLIMRSRNVYYSTLRILGANKRNTDNLLRIELVLMMLIAFALNMIFLALAAKGIIHVEAVVQRLKFLTPRDYVFLFLALTGMSLLIAKRYSRKIFSKSAMNVYREEA